jgi:hypothetical protein
MASLMQAAADAQGSGVERSGAAQGLAEVLGVLGPEYLAGLLPDILATCGAKAAVAREGSLTLFKFLPLAMPDECQVATLSGVVTLSIPPLSCGQLAPSTGADCCSLLHG